MNYKQLKFLWQQIASSVITEILCKNNDFDGVVLDNEHGVFSNESLLQCIQVATLCGKKCFVRLTEPNKTLVRYCLDSGVDGLIFSTVENKDQVLEIRNQCHFPFYGKRGYGLTRDCFWGEKERDKRITLIAQIETVDGVNWLHSEDNNKFIFDYFFIGPYDLSSSLGVPANFKSDVFVNCVNKIEKCVGLQSLGFHIVKDLEENNIKYGKCGFIAYSLDTLMIIDGIKKISEVVNEKK